MIAMFGSLGLLFALFIKRKDTPANLILLAAFVSTNVINFNFSFSDINTFFLDGCPGIHSWRYINILLTSSSFTSSVADVYSSCWTYVIHIPNKTRFFDFTFNVSITHKNFFSIKKHKIIYRLFTGLCILLVGGILQIFFQSTVFEIIFSLGGAFLFCLFIIFDTQMMMTTLSAEEYILATINLYMDIINLFLYILRILQAVNRQ